MSIVIKLAGKGGAASIGSAMGEGFSEGMARGKELKLDELRESRISANEEERLRQGRERIALEAAALKGKQDERAKILGENQAASEMEILRARGQGSPSEIGRRGFRDAAVGALSGKGIRGALEQMQRENAVLDKLYSGLAPKAKAKAVADFKEARQFNEWRKKAGLLSQKVSAISRTDDLLTNQEEALVGISGVVEDFIANPSKAGWGAVRQAEAVLEQLEAEQEADDKLAMVSAEFNTSIAAATPGKGSKWLDLAATLAGQVRRGKISRAEAQGQLNEEADPEAYSSSQRASAAREAADRRDALIDTVAGEFYENHGREPNQSEIMTLVAAREGAARTMAEEDASRLEWQRTAPERSRRVAREAAGRNRDKSPPAPKGDPTKAEGGDEPQMLSAPRHKKGESLGDYAKRLAEAKVPREEAQKLLAKVAAKKKKE